MATAFSSKYFSFNKEAKQFATEVSMLSQVGQVWDRIFADSADQGFEVVSEVTGKTSTWFVEHIDVQDGEIQGWRLKPTIGTIVRLPQLRGTKMLVVNT